MVPNSTTTKSDTSSNANATVDELMEMSPQLCSQKSTQQPQSPYSNLSSPARPQTAPNTVAAPTIESSPVGSNQAQAHQSPHQNNTLTPPPSITQHHRSHHQSHQQQSSVAMFRDKLGLNSPNGNGNTISSNHSPGQNASASSTGHTIHDGSTNPISPSVNMEPKGTGMDRRPSGASVCGSGNGGISPNGEVKFRYPSGASASTVMSHGRPTTGVNIRSPESQECTVPESRPVGCGTPSSTLSSREGTPLSSMQNGEAAPNIDISRVKIEESGGLVLGVTKTNGKQNQPQGRLDGNHAVKQEQGQDKGHFMSTDQSNVTEEECNRAQPLDDQGFNRMNSSSSAPHHSSSMSAASNSAFTSEYDKYTEQYIQHQQHQAMQLNHSTATQQQQQQQQQHLQMMQHHHQQRQLAAAGFGQFGATGMTAHDGMNNNLLSSSHDNQQHNVTIHPRHHHGLPHHAYYQHQLGMQPHPNYPGSTVHHHPGHDSIGMGGLVGPAGPSSMAVVTAAAARARHSNVKIGRRPSHLPKELKMKDKTLPPQWQRKLKQRKHGKQAGRWDVYIYSPCGVKFASRKKLKAFCEKNNLPYDSEDFDFTPYGRHIDNSRNSSSSNNSSGHNNKGGGGSSASANSATSNTNILAEDSGRHHSSTSTGSEGTHPGSSPSSQNNYSPPTNHPFLAQSRSSNIQNANNSMNAGSSSSYNPPPSSDFVGLPSGSFGGFDPRMDNPPNASALDIPQNDFSSSNNTIQGNQQNSSSRADLSTDSAAAALPYHPSRGHHYPLAKPDSGNTSGGLGSDFFAPVDIADMLMDSSGGGTPSIPSNAGIPNGTSFYGGVSHQEQHSSAYGPIGSDLNKLPNSSSLGASSSGMTGRSPFRGNIQNPHRASSALGVSGAQAPMSNISIGSRASEEGDGEDSLSSSSNAVNASSTRNSSGASGHGGPGNLTSGGINRNVNDLQMFNSGFKTAFSVLNSQSEYDGYPYQ